MPAGPTASEAAEIILFLIDVPIPLSFLFRALLQSLLVSCCRFVARIGRDPRLPTNTDTPAKGRPRLLCDRNTRGTILSSFPRYRTLESPLHHNSDTRHSASYVRDCNALSVATLQSFVPIQDHEHTLVTISKACTYRHVECKTRLDLTEGLLEKISHKSPIIYSNQTGAEPSTSLSRLL